MRVGNVTGHATTLPPQGDGRLCPRLAYVTAANAFAVPLLLPKTDREKDAEILVLRHQITVLEGQLDAARVRFAGADRVLSPFQPEAAGRRSMPEGRQALRIERSCGGPTTSIHLA
ncbi:hypothetical protein GCM10010402_20180 [Actinomadura luteofluorescens]